MATCASRRVLQVAGSTSQIETYGLNAGYGERSGAVQGHLRQLCHPTQPGLRHLRPEVRISCHMQAFYLCGSPRACIWSCLTPFLDGVAHILSILSSISQGIVVLKDCFNVRVAELASTRIPLAILWSLVSS